MLRSTLFVGVAVVIAVAVFLLTLIADSPKSSPATPSAQGDRQFKVRVPALDLENTIESTESLQQITPTAEGADGACYLMLWNTSGRPATIIVSAIYRDKLVKTVDGWRFKSRITE